MEDVVQVATDALRADAGIWSTTECTLTGVNGTAAALTCGNGQLSFVADATGLTAKYTELQTRLATLAKEGAAMSAAVAAELNQAADTYEAEDEAGVHKLNDAW